jgi:hypothetical protein
MSLHLLPTRTGDATAVADRALCLIISYENGGVKLWRYRSVEKERSIEGIGWECVWSLRHHFESGVSIVSAHTHPYVAGLLLLQSWQRQFRSTAQSHCPSRRTTSLVDTI